MPGEPGLEHRIRSLVRWNALAMVVQANRESAELGGHIASFASAATLYDVGMNHFFRAASDERAGDLVYIQGHSSPGIYARAYLEGRLSEEQLRNFRREVDGRGLSSYPHPWLMPAFWQFPTVSMGLGPIMGIYQARFMKYLEHRGILEPSDRKVWVFCGDGEMDEPEAIGLAAREKLDNLIFVVNCNLQRLDGPVRGNGKIIQELEGTFRGAGWNVLKVIWGGRWDALLAKDKKGILAERMHEAVDGDYQSYKVRGGAFTREHFFGTHPELRAMVAHLTDDEIWQLDRGGHDPEKIYAAYAAAVAHRDQPTVILAKTVKGYGMGESGEGMNISHQQKKLAEKSLAAFRDRYRIPIPDERIAEAPFYKPAGDAPEMKYMHERRKALGGYLPSRRTNAPALEIPDLSIFAKLLEGSGDREYSTTMAYVRILSALLRDPNLARHIVPIVPDEARTFGMEGLFRQLGIYAAEGQLYEPVDHDQVMWYREDRKGQVLQEGICEAGAMSSWIAAGTSYATSGVPMIPFFAFYSMFGVQRVGDLFWAAADSRTRGFLMAGTAGRTTLSGEGLQHQDGHSQLWVSSIPNCVAYDPAYGYELAVIVHEGLDRMLRRQDDVFYYITMMNENYAHPAMPENSRDGILRGLYRLRDAEDPSAPRVQLLGSGSILREVIAAADLLQGEFGVHADVWSATSFNELRRDGLDVERWNLLHPEEPQRKSFVEQQLGERPGPVIAATDWVKAYADQIRPFVPGHYRVLGTDGFGRSDRRERLRHFFEVNRFFVAITALKSLADTGAIPPATVRQAIERFKIDPAKPNPMRS
jgi:pyruvate dehydrogenase E1 component